MLQFFLVNFSTILNFVNFAVLSEWSILLRMSCQANGNDKKFAENDLLTLSKKCYFEIAYRYSNKLS